MMNSVFARQFVRRAARCLIGAAAFLISLPLLASPMGPGGINIGFDFNWASAGEPLGQTASFVQSAVVGGFTLNNCGGPVTATTQACDFVFSYSVGGVAQTPAVPGGVYGTWASSSAIASNPNGSFCDQNPSNSAPLTLFNCFNTNSFGQLFTAGTSGALSNVSMSMTCLNPGGGPLTGLTADIFQVNPGGSSIPSTPLAQVSVDLSTCPTLTSWASHTFSSSDFATIPLNFSGVNVTAGVSYGVFFSGADVPGVPLATPEPATLWPVAIGLAGFFLLARRVAQPLRS